MISKVTISTFRRIKINNIICMVLDFTAFWKNFRQKVVKIESNRLPYSYCGSTKNITTKVDPRKVSIFESKKIGSETYASHFSVTIDGSIFST